MNEPVLILPRHCAFVLSGGGARGFAHLGVLQAFAEQGIRPEAISATSAGSMVAALIANGYTAEEIKDIFLRHKVSLSTQWTSWRTGFLSLKKVQAILEQTLRHQRFEDLSIPLFISATNFDTGEQKIFDRGPLIPAILAASSIPVLFQPVDIEGVPYVDGGLTSNLPVECLLDRHEFIVGVHVNPIAPFSDAKGFRANLERTLHLAIRESVLRNQEHCDLYIEPVGLKAYGMFDFNKLSEIYDVGLHHTRQELERCKSPWCSSTPG